MGDDAERYGSMAELWEISIHIPRVGDDAITIGTDGSTGAISIHIPRVGDDIPLSILHQRNRHFNPHPPCGG